MDGKESNGFEKMHNLLQKENAILLTSSIKKQHVMHENKIMIRKKI